MSEIQDIPDRWLDERGDECVKIGAVKDGDEQLIVYRTLGKRSGKWTRHVDDADMLHWRIYTLLRERNA